MRRFLLSRFLQMVATLFVVVTVTFFLFRVLPGDPAIAVVGGDLPQEALESLRGRFGLDEPLFVQYLRYVANVFQGDFGTSFWYSVPALEIILEGVGPTLLLAAVSFVISYAASVLLAIVTVLRSGSTTEKAVTGSVLVLRAAPVFWTGVVLILIFSIGLGWFPHAGMHSPGFDPNVPWYEYYFSPDVLRHLVLPAAAYSLYMVGLPTLLLRTTMMNELGSDYVELIRAKGVPPRTLVLRHVFRNALLPFITVAGLMVGIAVGGQIAIEYVFSWPGMGRILVESVSRRDYPVAQAGFILVAVMVLVINLLVDIAYMYLNPKVDLAEAR